jgi:hypothetical protein
LNLLHTANLFESLGIHQQSAGTQWMLIIKLYRLQCLKEINFYYNGGSRMDLELFLNYHFDYQKMDNEVELVLAPQAFQLVLQRLERSLSNTQTKPPATYRCQLFTRDNRVMIALNDDKFQVARVNSGSMIERLLLKLERLPSSETLTSVEFQPNRNDFSFTRLIDKYDYKWLKTMLPVCEPAVISIQNPAELDMNQLLTMLPEIAENYRQPIARYLGIE